MEHVSRDLALIGAPVDAGAGVRGAALGPAGLRLAGLANGLIALGHGVQDRGDLPPPTPLPLHDGPGAHHLGLVSAWARSIAVATEAALADGALPILLGGDHSLSMGSITGAARHAQAAGRRLAVLWLDAHTDFNTPATTPSGNLHGMSAALVTGEPGLEAVFADAPPALVAHRDLHMFGIRSIDRGERTLLHQRGIDVVDMRHIDEHGVTAPLRRILDEVGDAMLHVCLDLDFLDPSIAPGVGTTVPGGATYREAHLIMEMLHDSGRLTSLDVVELNPFLDVRGQSAYLLVELVQSLFGQQVMDRPTRAGPR